MTYPNSCTVSGWPHNSAYSLSVYLKSRGMVEFLPFVGWLKCHLTAFNLKVLYDVIGCLAILFTLWKGVVAIYRLWDLWWSCQFCLHPSGSVNSLVVEGIYFGTLGSFPQYLLFWKVMPFFLSVIPSFWQWLCQGVLVGMYQVDSHSSCIDSKTINLVRAVLVPSHMTSRSN